MNALTEGIALAQNAIIPIIDSNSLTFIFLLFNINEIPNFAEEPLTNNCQILMESFTKMCQELGVPIADKKTVGPSTLITFLGLVTDTLT
jgi:hypothetical protein